MDLRRLRFGEWLAVAGGVALIVSLLLPWYDGPTEPLTGYEALTMAVQRLERRVNQLEERR